MEYVALTGMSERVISELKHRRLLTIEIRSPHNFFAALNLNVGDLLLLTHTSPEDVTGGTTGVVAKLSKHQVITQRTVQSNELYYEERETTSLRIQLDPRCIARVRKVINNKIGERTVVDADEIPLYNAH
ncbi:DUF473 domain-containing protein [Methanolobus sp. ZRKC3]|uniref:DUF473 domain-containing protein n=1 Tax=Methanolobus sp. ZRKC3 TaxID=3125786 RepID=UPI0032564249